ncbi:MAG: ABC-2 transporter permease [Lachnotalea sp.]
MNVIKFSIVDILRCKTQLWMMVPFSVIGFIFMKSSLGPLNGVIYMCFAAIILSTQPFMQEQIAESGFVNMLPTTKNERVIGRYLFGLLLLIFAMGLSLISLVIYSLINNGIPSNWNIAIIGSFGIGLIVLGFQYVVFYAMGKMKSQQFASLIMMAPGFILFFGANFIIGKIEKNMPSAVEWIASNLTAFAVLIMVVGIVIWVLSIIVTTKIIDKRDFI